MIIVLTILFIIVGILIWCFTDWLCELDLKTLYKNKFLKLIYQHSDGLKITSGVLVGLASIALVVILVLLPICHIGKTGLMNQNDERYKALTYKVESRACRDELGLLSKEVIDEVQAWNEAVVRNKTLQNDFWIGVFIPDIYDDLKTIDYELYK